MALVEFHDIEGPLRQGDLLRGLTYYLSNPEGEPDGSEGTMGVVVSRNCNAARKRAVLMAAILPYRAESFTKIDDESPSLDEFRRRFDAIRNGDGQPDSFYLGTLPGHDPVRFAARLDHIHTVEVPTGGDKRGQWISQRRFARLSDEHRRHLHTRLFVAVASEGFDDFQWWPTEDLEMAVMVGERQVRQAEQRLDDIKMSLHQEINQKKREGLMRQQKNAEKKLSEHRAALTPYKAELDRRS